MTQELAVPLPDSMQVVPGAALVMAIEVEARRRGVDPRDLASRFELKQQTWDSVLDGKRPIQGLHFQQLEAIADFLEKPFVHVLALAELLKPEHFVVERTVDDMLNLVYLKFRGDPFWSSVCMSESDWEAAPLSVRLAFALLYNRESEGQLLEQAQIPHIRYVLPQSADAGSPSKASRAAQPTAPRAVKASKGATQVKVSPKKGPSARPKRALAKA